MKNLLAVVALLGGLVFAPFSQVVAKNLAVPTKDPSVTLSVPDTWKMEEITHGYSAVSPGKDVFFSVEFANARNVKKLMTDNDAWMKENGIKKVEAKQVDAPINGIPATIFQFDTVDSNGKTLVEFIMMGAGKERMIMFTLWGSDEERTKHGKDIDAIMSSIKPIQ